MARRATKAEACVEDWQRRIVYWRDKTGISRKDLAEKVGVTPEAIHYWEAGKSPPTVRHLEKIAEALGISLNAFYAELPDSD